MPARTKNSTDPAENTPEPVADNQSGLDQRTSLPPSLIGTYRHHRDNAHETVRARQLGALFLVIVSLAFGFLGGWLGAGTRNNGSLPGIITSGKQTVVSSESQDISNIAKTVGQSVVSVDVISQSTNSNINPFGFGFAFPNQGSTQQEDSGTGIIISADGLILTNRHVIPAGATNVTITLSDGTQFNNVQVVGRTSDSDTLDIALLKINDLKGKKLVPAVIGDSAQMQVGDTVVAIGNALGQFQNTVTSGIISGYGRSVQAGGGSSTSTSENLEDLFQTDAAINEGNSGGPLVNLSGQVIGVNTAIAGNAQNIGFAIPINDITGLIKNYEQTGKFQRPYLGVVYIPVTNDVAQTYNLSTTNGAWIPPASLTGQSNIVSGGPADNAGLKEGDIITKVNGTEINQSHSLTALLDQTSVGQTVTLTIDRGGKTMDVSVNIGTAPSS